MFISLQKANLRSKNRIHFAMAGWFPGGDKEHAYYREAAQTYAPDVPVHFLDGRNPDVVRCCWAAADLFLSLVDNPQETFGLAPVEAMAAGIPVVVSDWDGYRYTVRHGVDGFRIPTLAPTHVHQGLELALQHDHGLLSYQDYVGAVASHIAVDTDAAAEALLLLADDPKIRQRMGASGSQSVSTRFDWPVIARLHHDLYLELTELRRLGQGIFVSEDQHPLCSDPFRDFAPFATSSLRPETVLQLALPLPEVLHRLNNQTSLDRTYQHLRVGVLDFETLLEQLQCEGPLALNRLLCVWPLEQHDAIRLSLTWLAKLGCIHWSSPAVNP